METATKRVSKLEEFNGANEAANPVLFEYRTTPGGASEQITIYSDLYNVNNQPDLSGDFDGDSHLDFIANGKVYTNLFNGNTNPGFALPFSATSRQMFAATTLKNGKLIQKQSIIKADETLSNIAFKVYSLVNGMGMQLDYTKNISFDNARPYIFGCRNDSLVVNPVIPPSVKSSNEYLEGDFNGE